MRDTGGQTVRDTAGSGSSGRRGTPAGVTGNDVSVVQALAWGKSIIFGSPLLIVSVLLAAGVTEYVQSFQASIRFELLGGVVTFCAIVIVNSVARSRYYDRDDDALSVIVYAFKRLPVVLVASVPIVLSIALAVLVSALILVIGPLVAVVLTIYLMIRFSLVVSAIVVDGKGPISGLIEGWNASKGVEWQVLGLLGVFAVGFGLSYVLGLLVPDAFRLPVRAVTGAGVLAIGELGFTRIWLSTETEEPSLSIGGSNRGVTPVNRE